MCRELTHFSLFTGIGGIDLGSHWAGFKTVGQCEIADFPTKVLEKHFPNVPRWRDIKDVNGKSFRERTGIDIPTIISAGFPCQPHSVAGKRKGSDDERDLWGEVSRVLCEIKPKWFLGENVPGILSTENGRFFGRVLRDLDALGYNVAWCVYGAKDVGAIHKRDRVFIIAYADSKKCAILPCGKKKKNTVSCSSCSNVSNSNKQGLEGYSEHCASFKNTTLQANIGPKNSVRNIIPDPNDRSGVMRRDGEFQTVEASRGNGADNRAGTPKYVAGEWREVIPEVGNMANGVPVGLVRCLEFLHEPNIPRLTENEKNRKQKLQALGNAVVPYQVYPILAEIANIEMGKIINGN